MTKKTISIVLCLFLMIGLILSGCGASSQGTAAQTLTAQSEQPKADAPKADAPKADTTKPADNSSSLEGKILGKGPNGEEAVSPATLTFSDDDISKLKAGNYTAAIVLHYKGNDWATLQEQAIRDTFDKYGIKVIAVTDANFKAEKQVADIENVLALKPNVIISIPVDPVSTANAYKKAAEQGVKVVFMDNTPTGLQAGKDYVSVCSADNYGNGVDAANIMAKELGGKGKVGVIYYDANFFVTNQRDKGFEDTIKAKYPGIQIVSREGFTDANKTDVVANAMLTKFPDINGIYTSWDIPGEGAVAAAKTMGKKDLVITTVHLGENSARIMAENGPVKGMGAQFPYDQGVAEAKCAAYALLGKQTPAFVAVPSVPVTRDNMLENYKKIYHKDPPQVLIDLMNGKK